MNKTLLLTTLAGATFTLQAGAAFNLLTNFETATVDTAITGWTTTTNQGGKSLTARVDPTDAGNLVAAPGNTANSNEGWVLALPGGGLGSTATGTLFARFYATTGTTILNESFGLVDTTAISSNAFPNYEVQLVLSDSEPDISARNGGSALDTGLNANRGEWYNVWMVADNSTDTWSLYINQGEASATAGDLVVSGYNFRNGTTDPLTHVQITVANVTSSRSSGELVYYDDIYFDGTGANLLYPVPEPSTCAALLGLLALGYVAWRRRR